MEHVDDKCQFCLDDTATVEAYPCLHLICDTTCLKAYLEPTGLCLRCPLCRSSVTEYRDRATKKTIFDVGPLQEVSEDSLKQWQEAWVQFTLSENSKSENAKSNNCLAWQIENGKQEKQKSGCLKRKRSLLQEQKLEILKGMSEYRPDKASHDQDDDKEEDDEEDDDGDDNNEEDDDQSLQRELQDLLS